MYICYFHVTREASHARAGVWSPLFFILYRSMSYRSEVAVRLLKGEIWCFKVFPCCPLHPEFQCGFVGKKVQWTGWNRRSKDFQRTNTDLHFSSLTHTTQPHAANHCKMYIIQRKSTFPKATVENLNTGIFLRM